MHIRRLRLDDDEDAADTVEPQPQPRTSPQQTQTSPNFPSEPVVISDDDLIDIPDDPFLPNPPPPVPEPQASDCPVNDFLRRLGFCLKRDSLADCLRELGGSVNGFQGFDVARKAKLCFEQFLFSDLNFCGSGVLPPNVESMHLDVLPGPYVLQVDEILNITCPLRSRYQQAPPCLKRCLKLSMTDGIQRVFGMEYRPIKDLEVCASSGLKVAISNVQVRHGLLMLVPETIQVLGGFVEELDAARKRLVDELNKPARGKRTRDGVLPPLSVRATLAAWPPSRVDDPSHSGSTLRSTDTVQANNQGTGHSIPGTRNNLTTEDSSRMNAQNSTSNSIPHMVSNVERTNVDMRRQQGASITTEYTTPMGARNATSNSIPYMVSNVERMNIDSPGQRGARLATEHASPTDAQIATSNSIPHMVSNVQPNVERMNIDTPGQRGARIATEHTSPMDARNATSNSIPHIDSNVQPMNIDMQRGTNPVSHHSSMANRTSSIAEEMHIDTANIFRENSIGNQSSHTNSNVAAVHEDTVHVASSVTTERPPVSEIVDIDRDRNPVVTDNTPLNGSSSTGFNYEDILMDDVSDNPLILSGDPEVPFTYLASLSAKWAAMKETDSLVQGKIKCFLTGVKGFQYKKRTTYELQAYVDDGSLISEILIDHDVVQKGIGYSPVEVTAALSSSDTNIVQNMKETMRKFQAFLANFEGVMLVELNRKLSLPLALEMSQGCPKSDAWSLLRRLKSLPPAQALKHFPSDAIVLSP
ncbi:recQ-mediated genome instability protein 1 isoform X1 [Lathyrus oleraceus]|nr:recQ-mediated genome instability protein 1 isoform X1 [Pisum sativum]